MKKRSLWIITALMTIALIGVFVMQLYYIREAVKLKTQIFEQNVNTALNAVANKAQKQNAIVHIKKKDKEIKFQKESSIRSQTDKIVAFKEKFKQSDGLRRFKQQQMIVDYLNFQDNSVRQSYITPIIITEEEYERTYYHQDRDILKELDLLVNEVRNPATGALLSRELIPRNPRKRSQLLMNDKLPDTIRYIAISAEDLFPRFISLSSTDKDLTAKFNIENASAQRKYELELNRLYADTLVVSNENLNYLVDVQKEMQLANMPLSKRISKSTLDTLIRSELLNQGIVAKYDFWLSTAKSGTVVFAKANKPVAEILPENTHRIALFNQEVVGDPGMLYVNFPDQRRAIFNNMGIMLTSSFGFLLLLLFIFTYTIYSIIRQKKISAMKNDFINNMTHEFKTPVATIMLASEALKDPEIAADKQRIGKLAGIIYDENMRLGGHIERVLSIAKVENKELKLERNSINLSDLVVAVTDSMSLQLQNKNARLILNLQAANSVIYGDELHLSNVIFNLIDNANKYSRENPEITITIRNTDKHVLLEVADKGIGISKEHTRRIFDQFYRVPTGNLHDVKGFGLGLNYVQDIITQMGATIKVNSEKDKGTVFEIVFPLNKT